MAGAVVGGVGEVRCVSIVPVFIRDDASAVGCLDIGHIESAPKNFFLRREGGDVLGHVALDRHELALRRFFRRGEEGVEVRPHEVSYDAESDEHDKG